jgi:hypothetical protein
VVVPKNVAVTGSRVRSACKSLPAERMIAVVSNDTHVAGGRPVTAADQGLTQESR